MHIQIIIDVEQRSTLALMDVDTAIELNTVGY